MNILEEMKVLAERMGTDIETMWKAFVLFIEKEIAIETGKPANDISPTLATVAGTTEKPSVVDTTSA